ncbi:MAG: NAD-dependent epimerase/dehydratase family protein [Candidatus Latescibacteria bacterium]|nr:NAD-dependent epimerase/dehydratase family protein [Candidatus Latescibacterota bacterium]
MTQQAQKHILITGMSGLIGTLVGRHLAQHHRIRALNRRPVAGVDTVQADIADRDAIGPAFTGIDTVVHLAALIEGPDAQLMAANVEGTYNVLEAARQAGVRRVVLASTGSVAGAWAKDEPYCHMLRGDYAQVPSTWRLIRHDDPVRPNGLYAASKVASEGLARYYAEAHGLSILCLRLGRVEPSDQPQSPGHMVVFLTHRDCIQAVARSVEAPASIGFEAFFVTSANKWAMRDLTRAQQVIGYRPQDGLGDWKEPQDQLQY